MRDVNESILKLAGMKPKQFYLNYEGCKCLLTNQVCLYPVSFIWTMRDVNSVILFLQKNKKPSFIWTMRDVNVKAYHHQSQNECGFIWTMRDVNSVILFLQKNKKPSFIWTMRDVNVKAYHHQSQNECGFIWTMRDVNPWIFMSYCFKTSWVLSELWGM